MLKRVLPILPISFQLEIKNGFLLGWLILAALLWPSRYTEVQAQTSDGSPAYSANPASQTEEAIENEAFEQMLKRMLSHSVPELSAADLASLLTEEKVILLDARETQEFKVSHLEGAVWVGYDDFDLATVAEMARNEKVVVYCSIGYRSEKISEQLKEAGFEDVANLYGGIFEWVNQGFPVYRDGTPTEEVHAYNRVWGVWLNEGTKKYGR